MLLPFTKIMELLDKTNAPVICKIKDEQPFISYPKDSNGDYPWHFLGEKGINDFDPDTGDITTEEYELIDWFELLTLTEKKNIFYSGNPIILKAGCKTYSIQVNDSCIHLFDSYGEHFAIDESKKFADEYLNYEWIDWLEEPKRTKFIVHNKGCKIETRLLFGCKCKGD